LLLGTRSQADTRPGGGDRHRCRPARPPRPGGSAPHEGGAGRTVVHRESTPPRASGAADPVDRSICVRRPVVPVP